MAAHWKLDRLVERLRDRREMNLKTAAMHPEPEARRDAKIRADTYELVLLDIENIAKTS
jgi:hypothetical protein